jgi:hypothetical protein
MYGVLSLSSVELGLEYGKKTRREVRSSFLPTSSHLQWALMWSVRIASMLAGMRMSRARLGVAHASGHEMTR